MTPGVDAGSVVADLRGRPLRDLRLSVTDRCDFRCSYCMPEQDYSWLPREDILTFDELETLVRAFAAAGVTKLRLTGGEPLLRRDLASLVARFAAVGTIDDISLTTNGSQLALHAAALRSAGLSRVTVSLDTMRPARHSVLTRRDNHETVLRAIRTLGEVGFSGTKINSVVLRDVNDDELVDLLAFAASVDAELRFIEYMDVGGATTWSSERVVPSAEILDRVGAALGPVTPVATRASAPARRYSLSTGQVFGIVASTTEPFCGSCDRSRVTADGLWYRCLYAPTGTDLRAVLRGGGSVEALVRDQWSTRADQGAIDRAAMPMREAAVPVELLKRDPHLEMHTRGG